MLIKCPECGGNVSDKAPACIHCGFPLNDIHKENTCLVDGVEYDLTHFKIHYRMKLKKGSIKKIYSVLIILKFLIMLIALKEGKNIYLSLLK